MQAKSYSPTFLLLQSLTLVSKFSHSGQNKSGNVHPSCHRPAIPLSPAGVAEDLRFSQRGKNCFLKMEFYSYITTTYGSANPRPV